MECKSCGKKLVYNCESTYRDLEIFLPPGFCDGCDKKTKKEEWKKDPETTGPDWPRVIHKPCGWSTLARKKRKLVTRRRTSKLPGRYGDGHFCGLTCGYRWAVRQLNEKNP